MSRDLAKAFDSECFLFLVRVLALPLVCHSKAEGRDSVLRACFLSGEFVFLLRGKRDTGKWIVDQPWDLFLLSLLEGKFEDSVLSSKYHHTNSNDLEMSA